MLPANPMYAYIPVKDVARARQFYEQKLGFTPKQEVNGGVVYEFGGHTACFVDVVDLPEGLAGLGGPGVRRREGRSRI